MEYFLISHRLKGKPDVIDIIEKKNLKWYSHVKRMPEDRIPKLIMQWLPKERIKRGWKEYQQP
jgi:hypothetical protein